MNIIIKKTLSIICFSLVLIVMQTHNYSEAQWTTVPVFLSKGDGTWDVRNNQLFPELQFINAPGVAAIPGDFDGDQRTDIAFHRPGGGWTTLPVFFSQGDGTWRVTNLTAPYANDSAAVAIPGHFNADKKTDIAFYRPGGGWTTVPVLLSKGDGAWDVRNSLQPDVGFVNALGVIAIPGDFDGDQRTDIAFFLVLPQGR